MFTQCPNCRQVQQLTVGQLRVSRAIAYCQHCAIHFDALELLAENNVDSTATPETTTNTVLPEKPLPLIALPSETSPLLPWDNQQTGSNRYWKIAACIGLLQLIGQFLYFEGSRLSQNRQLRPALTQLCQTLHCRLPIYQNTGELAVIQSSLKPANNQHYTLNALIINQAAFTQACPKLKLSLQDFNGNTFAYRLFKPQDYLTNPSTAVLNPDTALNITLNIVASQTPVGGYNLELSY